MLKARSPPRAKGISGGFAFLNDKKEMAAGSPKTAAQQETTL
jgi:hypothetical protein